MKHRKKPWPVDAVMLIASDEGHENTEAMQAPHACACRDCRASLIADIRCVERAMALPGTQGRPVKFFCITCALAYDFSQATVFQDYRPRRPTP